jgi:uncharacterized protein (DUF1501 family)
MLGSGIAAGAALALGSGITHAAFAAEESAASLLVIVHLRGGCDGLNFISPATDSNFIAARNSDLRVSSDGPDAGHRLSRGPDPRIDFRLHKSAGGLAELYQGGHLAFVHAAGLTDSTRSHFVATDMIEHGVAVETALAHAESGWIARYQEAIAPGGAGLAVAASAALSGEFEGLGDALAVPDLGGGFGAPGGPQVEEILRRLYAGRTDAVGKAGRDALDAMQRLDRHIIRDAQNHPMPYHADHDVNYDAAGDLGRPLRTVAQLAKMEIGLRIATVDIGGWDTHENQPGRFRNCVERLSGGIAAFYEDMWRYQDRLVVVTVTEFGRRLRSNRSNGTDHGRASVMAVLGGKVAGGQFYGRWPSLESAALDERVDLAVTTDYRQVLWEVLNAHGPTASPALIFPDYRYPRPLGLFKQHPGL